MGTQIHIIHLWNGTLSGEKQLHSWGEKLLISLNSQLVSNLCHAHQNLIYIIFLGLITNYPLVVCLEFKLAICNLKLILCPLELSFIRLP